MDEHSAESLPAIAVEFGTDRLPKGSLEHQCTNPLVNITEYTLLLLRNEPGNLSLKLS